MIKEIILKVTGLYSEMYGLREMNTMLETDLANANRKVEQLRNSYLEQKECCQKNYELRREAEEKLLKAQNDLNAAKETVKDLRNKLLGEQQTTDILRKARDQWANDYNTIAQRCEDIETKDEELTAKCNDQYVTIAKLNNDKAELDQKLQQLRIDNDQLTKENHELNEKVAFYKAKANHKRRTPQPPLGGDSKGVSKANNK